MMFLEQEVENTGCCSSFCWQGVMAPSERKSNITLLTLYGKYAQMHLSEVEHLF